MPLTFSFFSYLDFFHSQELAAELILQKFTTKSQLKSAPKIVSFFHFIFY